LGIRIFKKKKEKNQRGSAVDPHSCVSHFEKLNQVKIEFKERLKNLEIQLDMLEKQTTFNELDMHISKAEFVIFSLKFVIMVFDIIVSRKF
jgi:hypothetical protein